jgi:ATP-dependent DNA helicase DinG
VEELLGAGGGVGARWPRYAPRPGQIALARDIAGVIERGGVLLAEAPTGVGKSLAYLLPGVLHAVESGRRVVIATCTRSLQDQLYERDLPALLDVLGARLPYAPQGKQNCLCSPRALTERGAERDVIEHLRRWAATDPEGPRPLPGRTRSVPAAARAGGGRSAASPSRPPARAQVLWVQARRQAGSQRW